MSGTDDDTPAESEYSPFAKLAKSIAMAKAAEKDNDPSHAERAEELKVQAYEARGAADQHKIKPTLN